MNIFVSLAQDMKDELSKHKDWLLEDAAQLNEDNEHFEETGYYHGSVTFKDELRTCIETQVYEDESNFGDYIDLTYPDVTERWRDAIKEIVHRNERLARLREALEDVACEYALDNVCLSDLSSTSRICRMYIKDTVCDSAEEVAHAVASNRCIREKMQHTGATKCFQWLKEKPGFDVDAFEVRMSTLLEKLGGDEGILCTMRNDLWRSNNAIAKQYFSQRVCDLHIHDDMGSMIVEEHKSLQRFHIEKRITHEEEFHDKLCDALVGYVYGDSKYKMCKAWFGTKRNSYDVRILHSLGPISIITSHVGNKRRSICILCQTNMHASGSTTCGACYSLLSSLPAPVCTTV